MRYGADAEFPGYFDRQQLYKLDTDFLEQNNLVGDPEYGTVKLEMQRLLFQYLKNEY